MTEYALLSLDSQRVVQIVTTSKPLTELAQNHQDCLVKLVDDVPLSILQRYPYWNERP